MDEKLYISLIFSKLMVCKRLNANCLHMSNLIANFVRIIGICKDFAGNRVEEFGNVSHCGVVCISSLALRSSLQASQLQRSILTARTLTQPTDALYTTFLSIPLQMLLNG